jgi:TfoX/Sxy family transcriptional regulator of competence genes
MAFDDSLAERIRHALANQKGLEEKRMFGGLAFLVNGRMCCGVVGQDLMLRVGPDLYERALKRRNARPMDFTGRPMRGFIYVAKEGCRTAAALQGWVQLGVSFALSLPPK